MNIKILKTCRLCKCAGAKKDFSLLLFVLSALLSSFALVSCEGIMQKIDGGGYDSPDNEHEFIITGTVSADGAVPAKVAKNNPASFDKSAARTAVHTLPSSITYKVTATSGGSTVQGDVDQTSGSFTIRLYSSMSERWTLRVEGFSDSSMAENKKILEGSTQVNLSANSVNNGISIQVSPVNSGTGNVNLPISVATDSGIQSAIVKVFEDFAETRQIAVSPALEYDFSTKKNATISTSLASGPKYFVITFYSATLSEAKANPNQNVAYKVHETVNIFQNLTTDTWRENGTYLKNGQFSVTKVLTDTFSRKEFYVKGTGSTLPGTASDDNSGTYFDPFATLQQAVNTINAINDGASAYTIKVDGTVTQSENASAESFVNISSSKNLKLTIEGVTSGTNQSVATIDANMKTRGLGNGRVFHIGENSGNNINVTLKNLTLKGGKLGLSDYGSGIYLDGGNLTLSSVTVTDNSGNAHGGGIYINRGTCNITGGTISNNKASSNGGGIYVGNDAKLTLNGCTVSDNNGGDGGGIYVAGDASLTLNDGTKISNNTADNGGGIYVYRNSIASSGSLDITNSEISGNSATTRINGCGGGIYVENADCNIKGGRILNNSATSKGGGIYVGGGSCNITSGTISNNRAKSNGGGICVANSGSTLKITGTSANQTTLSGNFLTDTAQQETGTAIFVGKGATAEISGNVSITTGIAQGGGLPTIYLEKGQQAQPGGIRGTTPPIPDGALKLGGIVQIGSGGNTGIKMEKALQDTANIKITGSLVTAQTINISYAGVQNNNSIIEGEGYTLTDDDCRKFTVNNSHQITLKSNKGIYTQ